MQLPEPVEAFLRRPNPAVMAVVREDGQPFSVATWYLYVDGLVLVNMQASRHRVPWLRSNPRVALTVLADGDWYRHLSLRGTAVRVVEDGDYTDADRLARHYTGLPHTPRDAARVSVWIEPTGFHEWRVRSD